MQEQNPEIGAKKWTREPGELLSETRRIIRLKHYSISTERTYAQWITRFVAFHNLDSHKFSTALSGA